MCITNKRQIIDVAMMENYTQTPQVLWDRDTYQKNGHPPYSACLAPVYADTWSTPRIPICWMVCPMYSVETQIVQSTVHSYVIKYNVCEGDEKYYACDYMSFVFV
jgi:hypothetical protein